MRPQKIPGKAAQTWSLKMLNRIRMFPQNLALGMKTHKSWLSFLRSIPARHAVIADAQTEQTGQRRRNSNVWPVDLNATPTIMRR